MIQLDIDVGDIILGGRFKNKKITVKEIGTDDKGQPTINGRPILKFRIAKLMDSKGESMEKLKKTLAKVTEKVDSFDMAVKSQKALEDALGMMKKMSKDKNIDTANRQINWSKHLDSIKLMLTDLGFVQ